MSAARPADGWLVDWSDDEDTDFRTACAGLSRPPDFVRSRPLGGTVGSRTHRLRSYPAYAWLAVRGVRRPGVVVAWQPLAGALAGLLRRPAGPGLVVLNPILDGQGGRLEALALTGLRRADRVVVYAESAVAACAAAGLDQRRVVHVPLGVLSRPTVPPPDALGHLLAAGRDHRDWALLAAAAQQAGVEVLVAGPDAVPGPLRLVRAEGKAGFRELLDGARALVVPLLDGKRQAGTLAVLDGLAAGRPVVATRGPGTAGYATDCAGALVEPGDVEGLAVALARTRDPAWLSAAAAGSRAAAQKHSLVQFVMAVGALCDEVAVERAHA